MQIDGGIICNNPALYAYQIATKLRGNTKIRVLSIGTGEKTFDPVESVDSVTKLDFMSKMGEFMMNMDTYSADNYLQWNMPEGSYLRMQTTSDIGMDKIDPASIEGLKADGDKLYKENQEALEKMLREIIDERFG
mmetsp:Transcript_1320/g.1698  ORF Transcript_1320/g.1698 Transcript_1320/m.1698 type:complete len:135 (-) Transcript_1320:19-423(-)